MRLESLLGLTLLSPLLVNADWSDFDVCRSGAGVAMKPGCEWLDSDADGDVDQSDFGAWQREVHSDVQVYIFVVPATLRGAIEPEAYIRDLLNARQAQRSQ